jgi:hypothetical protein
MADFTQAEHFLRDCASFGASFAVDFATQIRHQGPDLAAGLSQDVAYETLGTLAHHVAAGVVLGTAFEVGDVFLMTHDISVGLSLAGLMWEQHQLNQEMKRTEVQQQEETKGLDQQQASELKALENKNAAEMEAFVSRGASLEEITAVECRQQVEKRDLAFLHEGQRQEQHEQHEQKQLEIAEKQRQAEVRQEEALHSKLAHCHTPTQQQSLG